MKNKKLRILGEIIVTLLGVIVLVSFPNQEIAKSLSIGFITGGITAILFEGIMKDEFIDELRSYIHPPLKLIDIRENMDKIYRREFRAAKKIDIIALTSEHLIKICGDLIIHKLLEERCEIRIAYLDQTSRLWEYRLNMEPEISPGRLQEILKDTKEFYERIAKDFYPKASLIKGSVIVRAYDSIPYFAYFRGDNKIILGFYYSYTSGMKSHAFIAQEQGSGLFSRLTDHFDAIWRGHGKEVISIHNRDIRVEGKRYEPSVPTEQKAAL